MLSVPEGWRSGFEAWLRERQKVPERRIPYLVRWVERFLRLSRSWAGQRWQDTLLTFLEDLGKSDVAAWQIRQAGDAVRLFCGLFLETHPVGAGCAASAEGLVLEPSKALEEMQRLLRLRHYAQRTERCYSGWARRYLMHVGKTGPMCPTTADAQSYLSHLAVRANVSASTQNQAFNAILFLHRHVFQVDLGEMTSTLRAKRGEKLPVVLTVDEVRALFSQLEGKHRMMLELVYGTGLRLSELIRLRVKDIDFEGSSITVRSGKGDKDRVTMLPQRLVAALQKHLNEVRALHEKDLAAGAGEAPLPDALLRKYPRAGREWGWQFAFPSAVLALDPHEIVLRRWHISPATVQKAMYAAVRKANLTKPASVHTLRHCYATHLLMKGVNIRRIQELLGHKNLETTMRYTHVLTSIAPEVASPLDEL